MINLLELVERERKKGYTEANAISKICQDIVLVALGNSPFNRNVTIKGGVVMRCKTKNVRRATQDVDIDFIKYSLSDSSIDYFIDKINCLDEIRIYRIGQIEALNQQDYQGRRIFIQICDNYGNQVNSKIDLGVHVRYEIEQEEYCFDVALNDEGVNLLINSNEQMFTEKLKSLLKFGPTSTRYKDIFDMYYLVNRLDLKKLEECLKLYIFDDPKMHVNKIKDISKRLRTTFVNKSYRRKILTTDKKWVDEEIDVVFDTIINVFDIL